MTSAQSSAKDRAPADGAPIIEVVGLTKSFDAVRALHGVDLHLFPGKVTALVGDNGAGKSTLVRCLTGVHPPDEGTINFRGQRDPHRFTRRRARKLGIETVYQDLGLIEDLQVWQNLFLNRELVTRLPAAARAGQARHGAPERRGCSRAWTSPYPTCAPPFAGCPAGSGKASPSRAPPTGGDPW